MSGYLNQWTMRKVANIILELTAWSWVIGITIAVVMTLSSCNNEQDMYYNQCENCDQVD